MRLKDFLNALLPPRHQFPELADTKNEALGNTPKTLQEQIFAQTFEAAEIAWFGRTQAEAYECLLKYYRDKQNVVQVAIEEA